MSGLGDGRDFPPPVFILAPPRSCSTVILALLAGHRDLFGFPEMLLFSADTVGGLLDERQRRPGVSEGWIAARLSGVLRAVAELNEGSQADEAMEHARQWLAQRAEWSTTRMMDCLLRKIRPRTGIEKSPDTVATDSALRRCLGSYPGARYLHLTRHPVTTQRSLQQNLRAKGTIQSDAQLAAKAASIWFQGHSRTRAALACLPSRQWRRVRAEDLLGNPAEHLPLVYDWLGLPHDEETIDRALATGGWTFANKGTSGTLYGGDHKFFSSPALRPVTSPSSLAFEPSWGLPAEICGRMQSLARELGYHDKDG